MADFFSLIKRNFSMSTDTSFICKRALIHNDEMAAGQVTFIDAHPLGDCFDVYSDKEIQEHSNQLAEELRGCHLRLLAEESRRYYRD